MTHGLNMDTVIQIPLICMKTVQNHANSVQGQSNVGYQNRVRSSIIKSHQQIFNIDGMTGVKHFSVILPLKVL